MSNNNEGGLENIESLTFSRQARVLLYLFKKKKKLFHLAVPGHGHARSLVAACGLLAVACGVQFSDEGLNLGPLHWKPRVLATGLPGEFYSFFPILTGVNSLPAFMPCNFPSSFHSHSNLIKYYHFCVGLCIKVLTAYVSRSNRDMHFQNVLVIVNKGSHDFQH